MNQMFILVENTEHINGTDQSFSVYPFSDNNEVYIIKNRISDFLFTEINHHGLDDSELYKAIDTLIENIKMDVFKPLSSASAEYIHTLRSEAKKQNNVLWQRHSITLIPISDSTTFKIPFIVNRNVYEIILARSKYQEIVKVYNVSVDSAYIESSNGITYKVTEEEIIKEKVKEDSRNVTLQTFLNSNEFAHNGYGQMLMVNGLRYKFKPKFKGSIYDKTYILTDKNQKVLDMNSRGEFLFNLISSEPYGKVTSLKMSRKEITEKLITY